jgi:hypothetical protein
VADTHATGCCQALSGCHSAAQNNTKWICCCCNEGKFAAHRPQAVDERLSLESTVRIKQTAPSCEARRCRADDADIQRHKQGAVARTLMRELRLDTKPEADDRHAPCGYSNTSCQYLHSSKSRHTAACVCCGSAASIAVSCSCLPVNTYDGDTSTPAAYATSTRATAGLRRHCIDRTALHGPGCQLVGHSLSSTKKRRFQSCLPLACVFLLR